MIKLAALSLLVVGAWAAYEEQPRTIDFNSIPEENLHDREKRAAKVPHRPNILFLFGDDMGYGDLSSFGNMVQPENGLDTLAKEGLRFTQVYSGDSLCTPARVSLMTGRLAFRSGMVGGKRVLLTNEKGGLPKSELTMPEMMKMHDYYTGMVGKWHLGINHENNTDGFYLPDKQGFDYVGHILPHSNLWDCDETGLYEKAGPKPDGCFLYKRDKIIQQPIHFVGLTKKFVADYNEFIDNYVDMHKKDKKKRFFFYFAFPHIHSIPFSDKRFKGTTERGLLGDNIQEMGWAVDEAIHTLKKKGLDKDTLVVFMADHGPHREVCAIGGNIAGLKGGKSTAYEGGHRIPGIVWMPGRVPVNTVSRVVINAMDLWPTFNSLAAKSPKDAEKVQSQVDYHDGTDITKYIFGLNTKEEGEKLGEQRLIFYMREKLLMAVRYKHYKIHFKTTPYAFMPSRIDEFVSKCPNGQPIQDWFVDHELADDAGGVTDLPEPEMYDLAIDPFELVPLDNSKNKDVLDAAQALIDKFQSSIVDVPDVLGQFDDSLYPCCDPPNCRCNYP